VRAVVTGGAGFNGSHLVDRLLGGGDSVPTIEVATRDWLRYLGKE
jgi:nucleoside-diphosphate-sugar epimerase